MTREYTNKLLYLIDDGFITNGQIVAEMLQYFSEDVIKEFCLEGFAGELSEEFEELKND